MVTQMPQWLVGSFVQSARAIGASASEDELVATALSLVDRYSEPQRVYHNIDHLIFTLTKVDELASSTHHPDTVRIAAWYTNCVFSPVKEPIYIETNGVNENDSASLAHHQLLGLGVDSEICDRVKEMILGIKTARYESPCDIDIQVLHDAVLAMLGGTPQEFRNFVSLVRQEHSEISCLDFIVAARQTISNILELPKIYLSPMGSVWELPARQNLEAELIRIDCEIANIERTTGEIAKICQSTAKAPKPKGENTYDTLVIKRISVADKLSKAKKQLDENPTSSTSTSISAISKQSSATSCTTSIEDLSSSMEMVEDCLDTANKKLKIEE